MAIVELDSGKVEVTYAMIDTDGTNLEEGVDVNYEGKYAFCVVGINPDSVSEDDLVYLNDKLDEYLYNR